MIVVLGHQAEFFEWIATSQYSEIVKTLRKLRSKVLHYGTRKPGEILSELRSQGVLDDITLDVINTYFREIPWAISGSDESLEDPELTESFDGDFSELVDSEAFQAALDRHTKGIRVGESSDEAWARAFGHLIPLAKEVEILDPFIGQKVVNKEPVVQFIFERLSKYPECVIRFRTAVPKDGGWSSASLKTKVEAVVSQLSSLVTKNGVGNQINVSLFSETAHNRWFVIKLNGGQCRIGCGLQYGVDTFKAKEAEEAHSLSFEDEAFIKSVYSSPKWSPAPASLKPIEDGNIPSNLCVYS